LNSSISAINERISCVIVRELIFISILLSVYTHKLNNIHKLTHRYPNLSIVIAREFYP
jgi:hypothetical protein